MASADFIYITYVCITIAIKDLIWKEVKKHKRTSMGKKGWKWCAYNVMYEILKNNTKLNSLIRKIAKKYKIKQ